MILSKKQSISEIVDGKEASRDTVVCVGENINVVPEFGAGPCKLFENFIYPTAPGWRLKTEAVLQGSAATGGVGRK